MGKSNELLRGFLAHQAHIACTGHARCILPIRHACCRSTGALRRVQSETEVHVAWRWTGRCERWQDSIWRSHSWQDARRWTRHSRTHVRTASWSNTKSLRGTRCSTQCSSSRGRLPTSLPRVSRGPTAVRRGLPAATWVSPTWRACFWSASPSWCWSSWNPPFACCDDPGQWVGSAVLIVRT